MRCQLANAQSPPATAFVHLLIGIGFAAASDLQNCQDYEEPYKSRMNVREEWGLGFERTDDLNDCVWAQACRYASAVLGVFLASFFGLFTKN